MSGPHQSAKPPSGRAAPLPPPQGGSTDLVRWAAFSCVLVPVVLLWFGTSLAGAAGTACGLAAVTAACRLLLRRSERGAARAARERGPVRSAHHRAGPRACEDGSRTGKNTPVG